VTKCGSVVLCTVQYVGLPSYLSLLLVKALSILVLSPQYTLLMAPTLADIHFTTNVGFDFKGLSLSLSLSLSKMVADGAIWLTYLDSATSSL
jgi:hypothetical protein